LFSCNLTVFISTSGRVYIYIYVYMYIKYTIYVYIYIHITYAHTPSSHTRTTQCLQELNKRQKIKRTFYSVRKRNSSSSCNICFPRGRPFTAGFITVCLSRRPPSFCCRRTSCCGVCACFGCRPGYCVYVCMYVCVYVCVYAYIHTTYLANLG
jgi:hypothetical protein